MTGSQRRAPPLVRGSQLMATNGNKMVTNGKWQMTNGKWQ